MAYFRAADERGRANFGWLNSKHSFSFGNYYDPEHMGFSTLRVINDDTVAPSGGFPPHGHRDMEIISVVLDGGLTHKDSMGHGSTIVPGDVQRISAGTGVMHSEFNASDERPLRFLQIWITPGRRGIAPAYEQKHFSTEDKRGRVVLMGSPDGRQDSLTLNQDAFLYGTIVESGQTLTHSLAENRAVYVHVIRGQLSINGQHLADGDGLGLGHTDALVLAATEESELLIFELETETTA